METMCNAKCIDVHGPLVRDINLNSDAIPDGRKKGNDFC